MVDEENKLKRRLAVLAALKFSSIPKNWSLDKYDEYAMFQNMYLDALLKLFTTNRDKEIDDIEVTITGQINALGMSSKEFSKPLADFHEQCDTEEFIKAASELLKRIIAKKKLQGNELMEMNQLILGLNESKDLKATFQNKDTWKDVIRDHMMPHKFGGKIYIIAIVIRVETDKYLQKGRKAFPQGLIG